MMIKCDDDDDDDDVFASGEKRKSAEMRNHGLMHSPDIQCTLYVFNVWVLQSKILFLHSE